MSKLRLAVVASLVVSVLLGSVASAEGLQPVLSLARFKAAYPGVELIVGEPAGNLLEGVTG